MKSIDISLIVDSLIREGRTLIDAPRQKVNFTGLAEADAALNDIENLPHLFVLGCVMDRQIDYKLAWIIPYKIGSKIGGMEFKKFQGCSLEILENIFEESQLHRFRKVMPAYFHYAIQLIDQQYGGDASQIWDNNPQSALVIRRFLEFKGVGPKIATMAANILVREFKIPMTNLSSIDISPDVRVRRFFEENGLIRQNASVSELIYRARELYPEFPGLLDVAAFRQGGFKRSKNVRA